VIETFAFQRICTYNVVLCWLYGFSLVLTQLSDGARHPFESLTILGIVCDQLLFQLKRLRGFPLISPQQCIQSRCIALRPVKSQVLRDLFEAVRVRGEIDLCIDDSQEIHRFPDQLVEESEGLTHGTVAGFHPFQKCHFIAAIMNELRVIDLRECLQKSRPDLFLLRWLTRPERLLNVCIAALASQADQVIKILIWDAFDI
jgi:hypothetical protein